VAQHPFLKSIQPVNLLSFGPDTPEIELRPLNILIGPNGSGKSNLIEVLGLLSKLPDKDPWSNVIQTGGAAEWAWKGTRQDTSTRSPSITLVCGVRESGLASLYGTGGESRFVYYSISLTSGQGGFFVDSERFVKFEKGEDPTLANPEAFVRDSDNGARNVRGSLLHTRINSKTPLPDFPVSRSALSMTRSEPYFAFNHTGMRELSDGLEQFAFYRDWTFGRTSPTRQVQPVGLDSYRLASDAINLAQVLKAMRDRGDSAIFDRLLKLLKDFYEPVKDVDTELVGTHLRIMLKEEGLNSRTPAERLSDGTLRWLMLLIILLDPTPPPMICLEEPELGLHPDAIHTLADLLVEASTRTQLVVTTHSDTLLDAFTETPEVVCVCEKVDGATVIQRLEKEKLKSWLEKYSLGHLWMSGEIGGNRW
jgi:predicted ATPase